MTADDNKIIIKTKQETRFKSLKSNFSFSIRIKIKPARGKTSKNIGPFTLDTETAVTIN